MSKDNLTNRNVQIQNKRVGKSDRKVLFETRHSEPIENDFVEVVGQSESHRRSQKTIGGKNYRFVRITEKDSGHQQHSQRSNKTARRRDCQHQNGKPRFRGETHGAQQQNKRGTKQKQRVENGQ